jgi:hypothetical protein
MPKRRVPSSGARFESCMRSSALKDT